MSDHRHSKAQITSIKVSKYSHEELKNLIGDRKVTKTGDSTVKTEVVKKNTEKYELEKIENEGISLHSKKMGATEKERCETCNQFISSCLGHFGGIVLSDATPFLSRIDTDVKQLDMILNSFCYSCRICSECGKTNVDAKLKCPFCKGKTYPKLIHNDVTLQKVMNLDYISKLTALYNIAIPCVTHSTLSFLVKAANNYVEVVEGASKKTVKHTLKLFDPETSTSSLETFLKSIRTEDLEKIGVFSRPENMIIRIIPVLPNYLRLPYVPDDGTPVDQGTNTPYKKLIEIRNKIELNIKKRNNARTEQEKKTVENTINDLLDEMRTHHNNLIFSSDTKNNTKSIKRTVDKKEGIMRKNVHGKRGNYCARSVVVPDPTLNIYECGIPEKIARELTTEELINEYNIKEMQYLLEQGGVKAIKRRHKASLDTSFDKLPENMLPFDNVFVQKNVTKDNFDELIKIPHRKKVIREGKEIDQDSSLEIGDTIMYPVQLRNLSDDDKTAVVGYEIGGGKKLISSLSIEVVRKIKLNINDMIYRYLRNGDVVTVNRNPTLHKNSILALIVEIRDGYCIRMPIQLCPGYGMDLKRQSPTVGCLFGCGNTI